MAYYTPLLRETTIRQRKAEFAEFSLLLMRWNAVEDQRRRLAEKVSFLRHSIKNTWRKRVKSRNIFTMDEKERANSTDSFAKLSYELSVLENIAKDLKHRVDEMYTYLEEKVWE